MTENRHDRALRYAGHRQGARGISAVRPSSGISTARVTVDALRRAPTATRAACCRAAMTLTRFLLGTLDARKALKP
jgi:hypothetical protein